MKIKPIKAYAVVYKNSDRFAFPDTFTTQNSAKKRMEMNEYYRYQKHMKVILVLITPIQRKGKK